MCGPRSFRIRMWIGIWPPSKRARRLEPEREPAPFCPRPEVLPVPDPSPRPDALARAAAAGRGRKVVQPDLLGLAVLGRGSSLLLDLDQVADRVQHAPRLRGVVDLTVWPMRRSPSDRRVSSCLALAPLRERRWVTLSVVIRRSSAASGCGLGGAPPRRRRRSARGLGAVASAASPRDRAALRRRGSPPRPSTWLIDRPRSSPTSSGVRRPRSPSTVALTRLIGFWVPRLLERMSWMPASSSTARTPPPAITPVPGRPASAAPGRSRISRSSGG